MNWQGYIGRNVPLTLTCMFMVVIVSGCRREATETTVDQPSSVESPTRVVQNVPIPLELPAPAFRGTPVPVDEPNVEMPRGNPRPPFLAPEGTKNLALGRTATCSDPSPPSGDLDLVTDGQKEALDYSILELRPGSEWVQVDLERPVKVYAVVLWHGHDEARVYRDVVVQVSDDPDFLEATTVFNNDHDNSSGIGIGKDRAYVDTSEGRLIDCQGIQARYVRCYSNGNHIDAKNHYIELEVYGI
jgi:hypothetical protein